MVTGCNLVIKELEHLESAVQLFAYDVLFIIYVKKQLAQTDNWLLNYISGWYSESGRPCCDSCNTYN